MIDYTKNGVPEHHRERLRRALNFERPVNEDTGSIATTSPRVARVQSARFYTGSRAEDGTTPGLRFHLLPSGVILLDGSWHKHWQKGTNHGQFTLPMFRAAVADVCAPFAIDPNTLILQVLEAGVNIIPPCNAQEVLKRLVCHREGAQFTPMLSKSGRSLGLIIERSDYVLKIYNKGRQYHLPYELLRIEVKFRKSRRFRALGIHTVADLFDALHWESLVDALLKVFDDVIIDEPHIDPQALTPSEVEFVGRAGDHRYWSKMTPKQRHRARDRYDRIVKNHAPFSLKAQLRDLIIQTCEELRSENAPHGSGSDGDVLTRVIGQGNGDAFTVSNTFTEGDVLTTPHVPSPPMVQEGFHPSVMGANVPVVADRGGRCVHCDRDISDQRPGSRFCSEQKYGKTAKHCRNAVSNQARDVRRLNRLPKLFDVRPFIQPRRAVNRHKSHR